MFMVSGLLKHYRSGLLLTELGTELVDHWICVWSVTDLLILLIGFAVEDVAVAEWIDPRLCCCSVLLQNELLLCCCSLDCAWDEEEEDGKPFVGASLRWFVLCTELAQVLVGLAFSLLIDPCIGTWSMDGRTRLGLKFVLLVFNGDRMHLCK